MDIKDLLRRYCECIDQTIEEDEMVDKHGKIRPTYLRLLAPYYQFRGALTEKGIVE